MRKYPLLARASLTALAVVIGFAVLPSPSADAGGKGFVSAQNLHRVAGSSEPGAQGGYRTWLRVRGDGTIVQSFSVWIRGLFDADGSTLWMASPGELDVEEVADFAYSDNGAGRYLVKTDSRRSVNPELPLGVERVLDLLRSPIEVRIPGFDAEDEAILRGSLVEFRYRGVGGGGRRSRLRQPPDPLDPVDPGATGFLRVWKRGRDSFGDPRQGVIVLAAGLTPDDFYEVWMEDAAGDMQEVGEMTTTVDGTGFFNLDSRDGDTLPPEIDVEDVRELFGRRVELRRSGFDEYSLVGLFPRLRR